MRPASPPQSTTPYYPVTPQDSIKGAAKNSVFVRQIATTQHVMYHRLELGNDLARRGSPVFCDGPCLVLDLIWPSDLSESMLSSVQLLLPREQIKNE